MNRNGVQVQVVERRVTVGAAPAVVWGRVTTPDGINDELRPILSMTMPPGLRGRTLDDADEVVGRPVGKAWIRVLGVVPVEYDDMTIADYRSGSRFHEVSSMMLFRRWEHERMLSDAGPGRCVVHDRLTFEVRGPLGRFGAPGAVARRCIDLLFAHRHRRLVRYFAASR